MNEFDNHRTDMAELIRRLESIDSRFERIERVVFIGNGQPAMTQRLTSIEAGQGKVSIAVLISMITGLGAFLKDFWTNK